MSSTYTRPEHEPPEEDVILDIEEASVSFDMERGVSRVLDHVSLSLRRDEILGVVGESGSGKSMFASALLDAVVNPGQLSGRITYYPGDREPVDLLELSTSELKRVRWEEISMVFQGALSSFNPTMTIRGHMVETIDAHDADPEKGMDRARQLLTDLRLDPERVLDSYPHELSGGMKQRALIALSLLLDPNVLVMDEPTAALDLLMQRSILNLLQELQQKYDLTLVFITHDLPLVAGLADRIAVMYAFEFVEIGDTGELVKSPGHPYTRALLKSTPNLNTPLDEMEPIHGRSPDPVNPPNGCSYAPRCPMATDRCDQIDPPLAEVAPDRRAACHYWDETAEALPLPWEEAADE